MGENKEIEGNSNACNRYRLRRRRYQRLGVISHPQKPTEEVAKWMGKIESFFSITDEEFDQQGD